MPEDTATLLTRLLQEAPGARDVYLCKSRNFWDADWTPREMIAVEREFRERYRAEVAEVHAVLGEPAFSGDWEDDGFLDWCPGVELTHWERGDRVAYLWWEHQDKELPFLLVAGAKTKDELAE